MDAHLQEVIRANDTPTLISLVQDIDDQDVLFEALGEACDHGNERTVEIILTCVDYSRSNDLLGIAVLIKSAEILKNILAQPRSSDERHEALRWAAEDGFLDGVTVLLPHCDQAVDNYSALRLALKHGHTQCTDIFLKGTSPQKILKHCRAHVPEDTQVIEWLRQRVQSQYDDESMMVSATPKRRFAK